MATTPRKPGHKAVPARTAPVSIRMYEDLENLLVSVSKKVKVNPDHVVENTLIGWIMNNEDVMTDAEVAKMKELIKWVNSKYTAH